MASTLQNLRTPNPLKVSGSNVADIGDGSKNSSDTMSIAADRPP